MKILFLTQWFQPEPFFKGLPFAKALRARGHEVEVLTGFPNYPGGKVYKNYCIRPWKRELLDGVTVNRVALYPSHDRSGAHRAVNYASFGLMTAAAGPLLVQKPDVIYVYNLVTLFLAGYLLKQRYRCPIVLDIQDLWPDSIADSGMMGNPFLLRLLDRCCRAVYARADHLVTLSPGMKAELMRRGVAEERISVVYNWCEDRALRPTARNESLARALALDNSFVVMFAGTMGVMQALDAVLHSAELIAKVTSSIKFVFVGDGIDCERLKQVASQKRLTNVMFPGRYRPEDMAKILALADVTLVHLKDIPLFRITIPSKIQAYMAMGKPMLMAVRGDAADIALKSGGGMVATPEDPVSIAQALLHLFMLPQEERERMGARSHAYYERELSMSVGVQRFEEIFAGASERIIRR